MGGARGGKSSSVVEIGSGIVLVVVVVVVCGTSHGGKFVRGEIGAI